MLPTRLDGDPERPDTEEGSQEWGKFPTCGEDRPTTRSIVPIRTGQYEMGCEIEAHREAGMVGKIVVK